MFTDGITSIAETCLYCGGHYQSLPMKPSEWDIDASTNVSIDDLMLVVETFLFSMDGVGPGWYQIGTHKWLVVHIGSPIFPGALCYTFLFNLLVSHPMDVVTLLLPRLHPAGPWLYQRL